uniref:FAR1 domain-containing protein n=1 Tax=Solanum lycopersicum TaxID=4081 RepID=K4BYL1_SOLLC
MEETHIDKGSSLQEDSNVNDNEYSTKANNVYSINKNFSFEIDMKFNFEEESYNAYNSYALAKGFGVRKSAKTYNINKEVTRRLFLCSCEGKSD